MHLSLVQHSLKRLRCHDQVEKLQELGLPLVPPGSPLDLQQYCQAYADCSGQEQDQAQFEKMLGKLREWRARYYTAIVPQKACNVPQGPAFLFCVSAPVIGGREEQECDGPIAQQLRMPAVLALNVSPTCKDMLGALLSSSPCLVCHTLIVPVAHGHCQEMVATVPQQVHNGAPSSARAWHLGT